MKRGYRGKKAAIEMSISTIVVIVIAMAMLVLGLVLVRTIFTGTTDNIKQIDDKVKGQINSLFSNEAEKKLVLYPSTKIITLAQGEDGSGFALSIRNLENVESTFKYSMSVENPDSCIGYDTTKLENLITLGKSGDNIKLASGNALGDPRMVRFRVPKTMPIKCQFSIKVEVTETAGGTTGTYETDWMDVKFKAG